MIDVFVSSLYEKSILMSLSVRVLKYLPCLPSPFSYAPWCPACQQIEATWESFARESERLGITVGKVDVTQEPGMAQSRALITGVIQYKYCLLLI